MTKVKSIKGENTMKNILLKCIIIVSMASFSPVIAQCEWYISFEGYCYGCHKADCSIFNWNCHGVYVDKQVRKNDCVNPVYWTTIRNVAGPCGSCG